MTSKLIDVLKLNLQPVAILFSDEEPEDGLHFKEGAAFGCVFSYDGSRKQEEPGRVF